MVNGIISEDWAPPPTYVYWPLTSCKKPEKSNVPIQRKKGSPFGISEQGWIIYLNCNFWLNKSPYLYHCCTSDNSKYFQIILNDLT